MAGLPLAGGLVSAILFLAWKTVSPDLLITLAGGPAAAFAQIFPSAAALFLPAGLVSLALFELLGRHGAGAARQGNFMLRMAAALFVTCLLYLLYSLVMADAERTLRFAPIVALLLPVGLIAALVLWPFRKLLALDAL